jgi:hypothetical protein
MREFIAENRVFYRAETTSREEFIEVRLARLHETVSRAALLAKAPFPDFHVSTFK